MHVESTVAPSIEYQCVRDPNKRQIFSCRDRRARATKQKHARALDTYTIRTDTSSPMGPGGNQNTTRRRRATRYALNLPPLVKNSSTRSPTTASLSSSPRGTGDIAPCASTASPCPCHHPSRAASRVLPVVDWRSSRHSSADPSVPLHAATCSCRSFCKDAIWSETWNHACLPVARPPRQ